MSIITPAAIKAIAHSIDVPRLADEAAKTLAPDVEYRLREVVQEALKFAKHAKRTKLTAQDINDALRLRNVEPLYGFSSSDPAKFLRVATHPELMFVRDPELSYHQLIEAPLPKLPREAGIAAHWLAINGVQPDLPENTALEAPPAKRQRALRAHKGGAGGGGGGGGQEAAAGAAGADGQLGAAAAGAASGGMPGGAAAAGVAAAAAAAAARPALLGPGQAVNPRAAATSAVMLQLPLRHAVSRELQVYFDRVAGLLLSPPPAPAPAGAGALAGRPSGGGGFAGGAPAADKQAALLRGALASVSADPGLHPLVPYFSAFIADGVAQHLGQVVLLSRLLNLAGALLSNPALHLEPYLQQLLPAVVTCVVTKALGSDPLEDHWALRRQAAALLSRIAEQFSAPHHNLTPRLCKVLGQAFLDAGKPLTSKYGAVVGLKALGPQVVRTLLIPHLEPFMSACLLPAMAGGGGGGGEGPARSQQRQQRQLQQLEAWQLRGALLDATGAAMYDLLLGHLQQRLPQHLALPHRANGAAAADWEAEYARTLLAARRPVAVRLAVRPGDGGVDVRLEAAGAQRGGAGGAGSGAQPSVAEVLGESWREDADPNATLGALLHVFGEDLLAFLPQAQLGAVSL